MAVPGSLPQRIFLLAYDPAKGRVGMGTELGAMLRAGALANLYIQGRLIDVRGRAAINGQHSCSDSVLAGLLAEITGSKPRKWQYWIGKRQRATVGTVRQQLEDGGWTRCQPYKILGLFPTTKVTLRDPRVRKELLSQVNGAFRTPVGRVDPADAALMTIVAAAELNLVVSRKTRRDNKRRIQELAEITGPIGPALRKSIQAAASGGEGA